MGAATRTWDAPPGEWHLSFTGELGGLWRLRGLPAQSWLGVATTAAGSGHTRPYKRTARSYDPDVVWVFDGVESQCVGDDVDCLTYPGGAAGFETDRFDPTLGSAQTSILLASATGFGATHHEVVDDVLNLSTTTLDDPDPDHRHVRADMALAPYPNNGFVFSVGTIAWIAAMPSNNYVNGGSTITSNVLEAFLKRDTPPTAPTMSTVLP